MNERSDYYGMAALVPVPSEGAPDGCDGGQQQQRSHEPQSEERERLGIGGAEL